jgi:hypothetical protein
MRGTAEKAPQATFSDELERLMSDFPDRSRVGTLTQQNPGKVYLAAFLHQQ